MAEENLVSGRRRKKKGGERGRDAGVISRSRNRTGRFAFLEEEEAKRRRESRARNSTGLPRQEGSLPAINERLARVHEAHKSSRFRHRCVTYRGNFVPLRGRAVT